MITTLKPQEKRMLNFVFQWSLIYFEIRYMVDFGEKLFIANFIIIKEL